MIDSHGSIPMAYKPAERDATGATSAPPRVLAADDQPQILEALELLLRPAGFQVDTAGSPAATLIALRENSYDALLMDLNYTRDTTSGREGMEMLRQVLELEPQLPVIVMTAWGNVELAVEAMQRGARDFISKPWENTRLLTILQTQVDLYRALHRATVLEAENQLLRATGRPEMIAHSPAMQPVLDAMTRVGPSDANVLITGEHGTGKEIVARTLHALSTRAAQPLIAVNTGGLAEGVFESELFGHVKGAFTDARTDRMGRFELADRGTLFLDEIANVPLRQQAKLLRVLESGEIERVGSSRTKRVDVRVLSATNANLPLEAAKGLFRNDLYFRLNTVEIHLPPLRERREDIPVLAGHFLARYTARYRKNQEGFDPEAMSMLLEHSWPGNIREMEHAMERAVLMGEGKTIRAVDLNLQRREVSDLLEGLSFELIEEFMIRKALRQHERNVSHTAEALGLSRGALYRRMEKYGI